MAMTIVVASTISTKEAAKVATRSPHVAALISLLCVVFGD
jgi:hypothetical protein